MPESFFILSKDYLELAIDEVVAIVKMYDRFSKIKIISNHTKYKKDQIVDLEEKEAVPLLTNGKAIRARKLQEAPKETKKDKKQNV